MGLRSSGASARGRGWAARAASWACLVGMSAAALLGAGCASAPLEVGESALKPPPRDVSFEVSIHPRYAAVEMLLRQPGEAPIALTLPDWKGAQVSVDIYDVHAWTRDGREALEVTNPSPGRWLVSGSASRDFFVRYVVVGHREALSPQVGDPDSELVALTGAEQFLSWGHGMFLTPEVPSGDRGWDEARVEVKAPTGWQVRTSWGRASTSLPSFEALRRGLIMAGDWEVSEADLKGAFVQVAVAGQWSTPREEVRRIVRNLVRVQSEVFAGYPSNAALITILPIDAGSVDAEEKPGAERPAPRRAPELPANAVAAPVRRARVLAEPGGAVFYLPSDLDPKRDLALIKTLAHEHFRLWSGQLFAPRLEADPGSSYREGHAAWFSEGVSEYYAVRTLLAMDLISVKDFIPLLNGWIKDYYSNPFAFNTPRAVLVAGYGERPALRRLAQVKGSLLGLILDVELRANSQGLRSLDQIMQKMALAFSHRASGYAGDDVRAMVEEFTGQSWAAFFEAYIDGVEVLPLADLSRGGVIVLELPFPIYDLGFKTGTGVIVNMPITEVAEVSEAADAGLKVGDVLRSIQVEEGEVSKPVKVTVEREGVRRPLRFEFLPTRDVDMPVATELTGLFEDWFRP